jgi:hypothetical protein
VNILKILPGIGFDWVNSETPAVSPLIAQLVAFHSWWWSPNSWWLATAGRSFWWSRIFLYFYYFSMIF